MTDPIGTAQLIGKLTELADFSAGAAGNKRVHPNTAERAYRQAADALQSCIAEVGRLLDALDWARDYDPQFVDQILDRAALSLQRRPTDIGD